MITLLIKSSFVLIVLLAFYKLFLEKESFFAVNRVYLLACLGLTFLLPFITLPKLIEHQGYLTTLMESNAPSETIAKAEVAKTTNPIPPKTALPSEKIARIEAIKEEGSSTSKPKITINTPEKTAMNQPTSTLALPAYALSDWLIIFYLFGVLVLTLNLISQLGGMALKIIRNTDKIADDDGTIVNMNAIMEPCSFFNYIFINPASYDFETYEQIIAHEKIHVQKGHTWDLLLAELAIIALWFNPFVWLFRKEVEKNIEYQTDYLVANHVGETKEGYQMNLLKIATYNKPLTVVTNYNQSLIKQRILKMNSKQSNPHSYWKYAFIAPLLLLILLLINKPQLAFAKVEIVNTLENTSISSVIEAKTESKPTLLNSKETPLSIVSETEKKQSIITLNESLSAEPLNKVASNASAMETNKGATENTINEIVQTTYNPADCDALEKAAKAGDKEAVKKLLLNYEVKCLSKQSESQIDNLDLIKDLTNREAEIYLEEKTGNITLRGTSFTIWSDARHKAYKKAHNQSNINNPIRHPELDQAVMESNELRAIQIIKNLDPEYLVYKEAKHLAHLDYMKYILKNGGKLTTSKTTIYIKHDADEFYIKEDNKDAVKITHQGADSQNSATDCAKLLAAISIEDITTVKALLKSTDVNCIEPNPGYDTRELENGMTWRRIKPQTPLVAAARVGNLAIGKLLVEAGAKVDFHGQKNEPPLIATAEVGDTEFTQYLLAKGADLSYNSNAYGSALNAAARGGHTETMNFLLKTGADIDATTNGQGTPLNAAARHGHIAAMKLLIDNGANINSQTNGQGSALNAAARHGYLKAVELLLTKGADIDQQTNGQGSALNAAARHGHLNIVKLLLTKGADINQQTNGQGSALNAAARHEQFDIAKLLLEKGADVNRMNNGQGTALMQATKNRHYQMVELLLKNGADPYLNPRHQKSPMTYAYDTDNQRLVNLFKAAVKQQH